MLSEIEVTDSFDQSLQKFAPPMRKTVMAKIRILARNPLHPSLNAHRLNLKENIWDCYINDKVRLLYEIKGSILRLWYLGQHSIVDKVHMRSFAAHTRFKHLDLQPELLAEEELVQDASPSFAIPEHYAIPGVTPTHSQPGGAPNRFTYFQSAHLRILGVPAALVRPLQAAPSLEDALNLPGLPERTRMWLEEISTSPHLEDVMFDSSRLLYRTTLDRLEDYCEGKIKRLMLNLQRPEQQQFVDMENTPLILLKGTAGSGKTTVGIYRAIRLAEQGRRVLVVTYNRTLASVTGSLIKELIGPLPENLQVSTLHSQMKRLLHVQIEPENEQFTRPLLIEALREIRLTDKTAVLQRDIGFFEDEIKRVIKGLGLQSFEEYKEAERYGRKTALGPKQREAVWKVYQSYQYRLSKTSKVEWADLALLLLKQLDKQPIARPFDDIIVDEAQDLNAVDLRVIRRLVSTAPSTKSSILILGDAAQTLYSRGFSWKQAGIQARGRTAVLRKNFRNTRQIAEAAAQLLEYNVLMRSTNEYVDPEWTQRQGPLPIVVKVPNSYAQIEFVRDQILDLANGQEFRLSDFAILCPTNDLCSRCQQELTSVGLRTILHKDRDFDLLDECVKILTIHSAKGLEFPVVFLVGVVEGTLPLTQESQGGEQEEAELVLEQQRTRFYVGMTRAAEALFILTVKGRESRFIDELAQRVTVRYV